MIDSSGLPNIETLFSTSEKSGSADLYLSAIRNILKQLLPGNFFPSGDIDDDTLEDLREQFHGMLPLMVSTYCEAPPCNQSFFIVYKRRPTAFKFVLEMIRSWLVPGKRLRAPIMYAADFQIPAFGEEVYTVCEVMVRFETAEEVEEMQRNLSIIESEVRLGLSSSYYARRILEVKGLSSDEKTAQIQEHIAYMFGRLPKAFDHDIFTEMQHVLVMCRDEFKAAREVRHLSRLITVQYIFRKWLREAVKSAPEKRHLRLKVFRAFIHQGETARPVLGVLVGINFLVNKEVLEQDHLLKAIQNYIPKAQAVEDSFFANRRGTENVCTLYLEIEKNDGKGFTTEEIRELREELSSDLEGRIEHLMHPVFMPRNEEEVMRNILSLSNQIKYLRDIPQVFISFDEQSTKHLYFTIILVRVLKKESLPIAQLFEQSPSKIEYIHDRARTVGYLRKKYEKEATVFRLKLPKQKFLRQNNSIDLYKARQAVVAEINRVVGDVRDFNGGMITKQNELLCEVRDLLADEMKFNELLLENFFYSLYPVMMRAVLPATALRALFLMLIDAIEYGFFSEEGYSQNTHIEPDFAFAMISAEERITLEEIILEKLKPLEIGMADLAMSNVKLYETHYLGYIYRCSDLEKQEQFCEIIRDVIDEKSKHGLSRL